MSQSAPLWLEYAKLIISLLNPLMTGMIGLVVLRLGMTLEKSKQLNQALLNKRLSLYEQIAPKLNDIYCFYRVVGHWKELSPADIIERKRVLDRAFYINLFLFDDEVLDRYRDFVNAHFQQYSAPGETAKLRLDVDYLRNMMGNLFQEEWQRFAAPETGSRLDQLNTYQGLMDILGKEVKGEA